MDTESSELLKVMFEVDPGALAVVTGPDLVFRAANPAYCALTPNADAGVVGRPYAEVWQDAEAADRVRAIREVIDYGKAVDGSRSQVTFPDGTLHYVSHRIRRLVWEGTPGALMAVWDLTDQEMAQQQVEEAVKNANRRMVELETVLNALPDSILIYNEDGQVRFANQAFRDILNIDPLAMNMSELLENFTLRRLDGRRMPVQEIPAMRALRGQHVRGTRLMVNDPQGRQIQLRASASPLYEEGSLIGAVTVWSDITEMTQRRQELEVLAQVAGALRDTIVQEEMFPIVLNQITELLHVDGASILMPDPATADLLVRAAAGVWGSTVGQRLPAGTGISFQVMSEGQPYRNNEIQKDKNLARVVFAGDLPCGACVPLLVQESVIGVLWIGRGYAITEEEVHLLLAIADMAGSSLYRARLFEQTQLRFTRLSALHSIDMAITSSLDLQLTLSVLLDQVVSQMSVDAADILLYDPNLHWLEFASGRGFMVQNQRAEPLRLADTPARQAIHDRQMLIVPDLSRVDYSTDSWLPAQEGFRAYFAAPLISKGQVKGVIELYQREVFHPDAEWLEFLETLATQAAIALDSAELFNRLQRTNEEIKQAYDATIEGWSRALELRDRETEGHSRRVTEMTIRLARRMGISDEEIAHYRRGVLLHDIGKMAIPDAILLKDGPLEPEEQDIMRLHPTYAYDLLKPIPYLRQSLDIPYCHHEWWDGRGYPRGLKSEEIPMSARIFAVIDVYDALTNKRSYRPPWPEQKVIEYIRSLSGVQFDPRVVDAFVKMIQGYGRADRMKPF